MNKLRECTLCTFSTYKQSTFSMHMLMKHPKKKPHQCTLCTETFAVKTQLQHHMINKHTKSVITCQYPGCKLKFKNHTAEMVHYMKRHIKAEEYFEITEEGMACCLYCDSIFNKAAIYYHVGKCNPESPFHPNNAFFETYCPEYFRESDINLCVDCDESSIPLEDDDITIYSDSEDILQNILYMDKSMDSAVTETQLNHPFKENIPLSASEANAYDAIMREDPDGEALKSLYWFG